MRPRSRRRKLYVAAPAELLASFDVICYEASRFEADVLVRSISCPTPQAF